MRRRFLLPFLCLQPLILLFSGCLDRDGRHASTNYFANATGPIVTVKRIDGSEFNYISFWVRMESDDFVQTGEMCFLVNGLSYDSNPPITVHLQDAYLEIGGQRIACRDKSDTPMVGKVNPRNGETRLEDIRIHFPYDRRLHWGEKITSRRLVKELEGLSGFNLVVPMTVPAWNTRPESMRRGEPKRMRQVNAVFHYTRYEQPGEKWIHLGSW